MMDGSTLDHLRSVVAARMAEKGSAAESPLTCAEVLILIGQAYPVPAPTPAPTLTAAEEAALNRAIKQLNNLSCGTVIVLIRLRDRLLAAGAPDAAPTLTAAAVTEAFSLALDALIGFGHVETRDGLKPGVWLNDPSDGGTIFADLSFPDGADVAQMKSEAKRVILDALRPCLLAAGAPTAASTAQGGRK